MSQNLSPKKIVRKHFYDKTSSKKFLIEKNNYQKKNYLKKIIKKIRAQKTNQPLNINCPNFFFKSFNFPCIIMIPSNDLPPKNWLKNYH